MSDLSLIQTLLIGIIFAWSSFTRSAFNFGGGLLSLPLLLAVHNEPIVFIPVIAVHLFIFSIWVLLVEVKPARLANEVDWPFLKSALRWMVGPKLLGITGLVLLPAHWMGLVVLLLCAWFAIEFLKRPQLEMAETHTASASVSDKVWLMIAGYTGGAALLGSPLVLSVFVKHVSTALLRPTLFVLWLVLVSIKLIALMVAQVDMQWDNQWWLFPCAVLGHWLGAKVNGVIRTKPDAILHRVIGGILIVIIMIYGTRLAFTFADQYFP